MTELQENMVLTLEPSLSYGDGLMMVHEENIVVSSGGGRLLTTRAAPELPGCLKGASCGNTKPAVMLARSNSGPSTILAR